MCLCLCTLPVYTHLSVHTHAMQTWVYSMLLDSGSPQSRGGPGQVGLPLLLLRTWWGPVLADIDECLSSPCVNGACRNLAGSYACDCGPGSRLGPSGTVCLGERLVPRSSRDCAAQPCVLAGWRREAAPLRVSVQV